MHAFSTMICNFKELALVDWLIETCALKLSNCCNNAYDKALFFVMIDKNHSEVLFTFFSRTNLNVYIILKKGSILGHTLAHCLMFVFVVLVQTPSRA